MISLPGAWLVLAIPLIGLLFALLSAIFGLIALFQRPPRGLWARAAAARCVAQAVVAPLFPLIVLVELSDQPSSVGFDVGMKLLAWVSFFCLLAGCWWLTRPARAYDASGPAPHRWVASLVWVAVCIDSVIVTSTVMRLSQQTASVLDPRVLFLFAGQMLVLGGVMGVVARGQRRTVHAACLIVAIAAPAVVMPRVNALYPDRPRAASLSPGDARRMTG